MSDMPALSQAIEAARAVDAGVAYSAEDWRLKAKLLARALLTLAAPGQSATEAADVADLIMNRFLEGKASGHETEKAIAQATAAFAASRVAAVERDLARAREALDEIANPIKYMRRRAEAEGARLNEYAVTTANNAEHLKQIARAALGKAGGETKA